MLAHLLCLHDGFLYKQRLFGGLVVLCDDLTHLRITKHVHNHI